VAVQILIRNADNATQPVRLDSINNHLFEEATSTPFIDTHHVTLSYSLPFMIPLSTSTH
jgi:hypothetical protein